MAGPPSSNRPSQAPNPAGVVRAVHTAAGGWGSS